jgi:threonine aldolase
MRERLADDHANAKLIANGLAGLAGLAIDPAKIVTNIVIFEVARPVEEFLVAAKTRGVLLSGVGGQRVRAVTHFDVSRQDCERAVETMASI